MPKAIETAKKVILSQRLKRYIDVNTDFGQAIESHFFAEPEQSLLPFVSTVYIPCGVHEGMPETIMTQIEQAKLFNCALGAHVGLPDPYQRGNVAMPTLSSQAFRAWLLIQLGGFKAMAQAYGLPMEQVRPHGALYAAFFNDPDLAKCLAETVYQFDQWLTLVGPAGEVLESLEKEIGIRVAPEMHLGKRYGMDGQPVLSQFRDSLSPQAVLDQARQLITDSSITTAEGKILKVRFSTLHLSPRLDNALMVADRLNLFLGQPVSLNLAAAGASGWL